MTIPPKEFGQTSFDELVQLVELFNSLPGEKAAFFDEYNKQPEKLHVILDQHFAWGVLYEFTLIELIAYFSIVSGFNQILTKIAQSDNPTEAALTAAFEDNLLPPFSERDPEDKRKFTFVALMALSKSIDSIRLYGISIDILVKRVKQGNDDALFKLLRIDRSAVSCPTIADRITLAELDNDQTFFQKMRNALSGPPQKPKDEYGVLRYILYLLDEEQELSRLSLEQRYQLFCERLQLYPIEGEDPAKSLDQFIRRWQKEFST